jgi:hypothetical protein
MACRLIAPFQKGETDTFMKHAEAALELLVNAPDALLVFSGWAFPPSRLDLDAELTFATDRGPTKKPSTELSEAQSYFVSSVDTMKCQKTMLGR